MINFLKKIFTPNQNTIHQASKRLVNDANSVLDILKECDIHENGINLYLTCLTAVDLQITYSLPVQSPYHLLELFPDYESAAIYCEDKIYAPLIRYQQEGRMAEATGIMIWRHTFVAIFSPEVKSIVKECWKELHIGKTIAEKMLLENNELDDEARVLAMGICLKIPEGFE